MCQSNTPEWRTLMGYRQRNSDGFTYSYGRYPFNATNGARESVKRCIRSDKRSVKRKELRRIQKELEDSV